MQPLATNAVVGQDATFCGRDDDGNKRWAEVQRDTASTKTVGLACGPAATGEDVMAQLEALRAARGELPLVFACDRGAQYENATVKDYLEANGVVLLPRLPRTPQHNAWSERGIRELKEAAQLDPGMPAAQQEERLKSTAARLDANRRHATRKGLTADQADSILPRATSLVPRQAFYATCRRAMEGAERRHEHSRARTLACRKAAFAVMERFGLVRITGGRAPSSRRRSVPN